MTSININQLINPDFANLATEYKELNSFISIKNGNTHYDFGKENANLLLAQCLAKKHFGVTLQLDNRFLCPRIPNRYLYVKIIQSLVQDSFQVLDFLDNALSKETTVLDIGVGSSCIYPLLLASLQPNWNFIGTDINQGSLDRAARQLDLNPLLKPRIRLSKPSNPSFYFETLEFDVCMCNPPFYDSVEQFQQSRDSKKKMMPSVKAFVSKSHEMITDGGEYRFVLNMINQSNAIGERVLWFTSLLGYKESVGKLIQELKNRQVPSYGVYEISTLNHLTKRWVLVWSYKHLHISSTSLLSPKTWSNLQTDKTIEQFNALLLSLLDLENNPECVWKPNVDGGMLKVDKDIWSRSYRRRLKNKRIKLETTEQTKPCIFKFVLKNQQLCIYWKYGQDYKIFDSLVTLFKANI